MYSQRYYTGRKRPIAKGLERSQDNGKSEGTHQERSSKTHQKLSSALQFLSHDGTGRVSKQKEPAEMLQHRVSEVSNPKGNANSPEIERRRISSSSMRSYHSSSGGIKRSANPLEPINKRPKPNISLDPLISSRKVGFIDLTIGDDDSNSEPKTKKPEQENRSKVPSTQQEINRQNLKHGSSSIHDDGPGNRLIEGNIHLRNPSNFREEPSLKSVNDVLTPKKVPTTVGFGSGLSAKALRGIAEGTSNKTTASNGKSVWNRLSSEVESPRVGIEDHSLNSAATAGEQTRPTHGGKSLTKEMYEALNEVRTDEESTRENSPLCDEDLNYWVYQVKRMAWGIDDHEDQADWQVVSMKSEYMSLHEATMAAQQEIFVERDGLAASAYTGKWTRQVNEFEMVSFFVEQPEGSFRVKVDRFFRNSSAGIYPASKIGWFRRIVYDIMRKTDIHEAGCNQRATTEVVDGVYTILDQANRAAGRLVLEMKIKPLEKSMRIDDVELRVETRKQMSEKLNKLEESQISFKESFRVSDKEMVEIWVEERILKSPRNI